MSAKCVCQPNLVEIVEAEVRMESHKKGLTPTILLLIGKSYIFVVIDWKISFTQ